MARSSHQLDRPDVVSCPGETLQEILEDRGMSQVELAQRLGHTTKHVNKIIKGKASITPEVRLRLERVLGVSAEFWRNREGAYRDHLEFEAENIRLLEHYQWARSFPYAEMMKYGLVKNTRTRYERVRELISFFGVSHPDQWSSYYSSLSLQYRMPTEDTGNEGARSAWLRWGENLAGATQVSPYNNAKFKALVPQLKSLSLLGANELQSKLVESCSRVGVIVIFVPELKGACVTGVTRWKGKNPIIQLSLRYKTDDQLWFTFFHECYHILNSGKSGIYLNFDNEEYSEEEKCANDFAADILIDRMQYNEIASKAPYISSNDIKNLAARLGISPGIVVGRLQHDGHLKWQNCNGLKRSYNIVIGSPD